MVNFGINRDFVFHSAASVTHSLIRYYSLVVVFGSVSLGLSRFLLVHGLSAGGSVAGLLQVNVLVPESANPGSSVPIAITVEERQRRPE